MYRCTVNWKGAVSVDVLGIAMGFPRWSDAKAHPLLMLCMYYTQGLIRILSCYYENWIKRM